MKSGFQNKLFLLISLIFILISYYPSFSGYFEFDDFPNIKDNMELRQISGLNFAEIWQAAWASDSGTLRRPVSMFTFGLQVALTGFDTYPMKIFNLIIHWTVGFILFLLSRTLLSHLSNVIKEPLPTHWLSFLIALIWVVHPFNLTNVSYIVQRMNSLSALFTSLALLQYSRERLHQQAGRGRWITSISLIFFSWFLGIFSKENAILLPIYLIVIEYFIFRFKAILARDQIILRGFFSIVLSCILAFLIIFWFSQESILSGYQIRDFNMWQRLLTESRILVWYIYMLILPDISQMTLYHDNIMISKSLFSPPETIFSILLIVCLVLYSFQSRKNYPWIGFGILWFLGGHLLESTIIPLELVYEHRNYLPSFGIIFAIILSLQMGVKNKIKSEKPLIVFLSILVIFLIGATHTRAYIWSGSLKENIIDATNHPQSVRANINGGNAFSIFAKGAQNDREKKLHMAKAEEYYKRALEIDTNSTNPFFGWIFMYYENKLLPPQTLIDELKYKIGTTRIDATTANGLDSLTRCQVDGNCKLSDEEYLTIMDGAFDNPNSPNIFRSNFLRNMATFYSTKKQDSHTAAILTKKAIELNPNHIGIRLELVQHLLQAGYSSEALTELHYLERIDKLKQYQSIISKWKASFEDKE